MTSTAPKRSFGAMPKAKKSSFVCATPAAQTVALHRRFAMINYAQIRCLRLVCCLVSLHQLAHFTKQCFLIFPQLSLSTSESSRAHTYRMNIAKQNINYIAKVEAKVSLNFPDSLLVFKVLFDSNSSLRVSFMSWSTSFQSQNLRLKKKK
jgi:hypothetical protein